MSKLVKKYFIFERRDMSRAYRLALMNAGYRKTVDPEMADFLLYDLEQDTYKPIIEDFARKGKPIFVYPHSANSWYFWDGFHEEYPVKCNFVFTRDIKTAMFSYGYKSRLEPCGFPFAEVFSWKPMREKTLLFAPMHTMGLAGEDYLCPPASFELNRTTLERVFKLAPLFKRITVRYGKSFSASGMYDPGIPNVHFEKAVLKNGDARRAIKESGMVIAAGSLAYLAVAAGKPTIFFNQRGETPKEGSAEVRHYNKYRFIDYPAQLSDMSNNMVMEHAVRINQDVEKWKKANIGSTFSAVRFISVIKEYVKID
jgi:hypothetical protein